ncbi:MAG: hypothetical protein PWP11_142 [Thauera sp.]|jgi:hypothetical protein|nr:hypothetical protein [Thauera sp.]
MATSMAQADITTDCPRAAQAAFFSTLPANYQFQRALQ